MREKGLLSGVNLLFKLAPSLTTYLGLSFGDGAALPPPPHSLRPNAVAGLIQIIKGVGQKLGKGRLKVVRYTRAIFPELRKGLQGAGEKVFSYDSSVNSQPISSSQKG